MRPLHVALITFGIISAGLPAYAADPFYKSEILEEVELPDGSLLRTSKTTEVIRPEPKKKPIELALFPDPQKGELCRYVTPENSLSFRFVYDAPLGDEVGQLCFVWHGSAKVLGLVALVSDL